MGYRSAEEVLLPARFLTLTAHFVAILTVVMDPRSLAAQMLLTSGDDAELYSAEELAALTQRLAAAAYGAIACFAVEYAGLFGGVSLFLRGHACAYIVLHFAGAVLTSLLFTGAWSASALVAFVVVFNALPAALELLTFAYVARVSLFSY